MYTCKSLFFSTDLNQSFQAQHMGVSFGGQSLLWGEWPSGPAEKVVDHRNLKPIQRDWV